MRCVSGVAAAVLAAVFSFAQCPAFAEDKSEARDESRIDLPLEPAFEPRFMLFANTDLWRHGGFAHGGLLAAPNGLDREGLVFKLMFGGGSYRYTSGALGNIDVVGAQLGGAAMFGWRFIRNGFIVTVFAGVDYQDHRLTPDDPSAGLRGEYFGLRTAVELWYEPSANTMVAADASVSTVGPSYSARIAAGWRIFDHFYLGPEVQAFAADDNYQQTRFGVHVTGMKFSQFEWSAGLGWASDSDDRDGLYGKLGLLSRH
jgi:Cellulose biosynthesis protein BcsS